MLDSGAIAALGPLSATPASAFNTLADAGEEAPLEEASEGGVAGGSPPTGDPNLFPMFLVGA